MIKEKEPECLLCGNTFLRYRGDLPGYQEPDRFQIYTCNNCDTSFALPNVSASGIYQHVYNAGDRIPGYGRYWEYAKSVQNYDDPLRYLIEKEDVYWAVNQVLSKLVVDKKNTRILEIGCGVGYFTYSLRKAGYQAIGLDISQSAVDRAIELFGDYYLCGDINEYSTLKEESYNIVIMAEVIEHIDNPIATFESVKGLLCQNGVVIVTTPNKSFYDDEIAWETELPPIHRWWFSESSFKYMGEILDFKIEFVDFGEYYSNHFKAINFRDLFGGQSRMPILNENGEVIIKPNKSLNLAERLKEKLKRNSFWGLRLQKLNACLNRNIRKCSDRGTTLCAILYKQ